MTSRIGYGMLSRRARMASAVAAMRRTRTASIAPTTGCGAAGSIAARAAAFTPSLWTPAKPRG